MSYANYFFKNKGFILFMHFQKEETMATEACPYFYECEKIA
jgi:hypothetical protein